MSVCISRWIGEHQFVDLTCVFGCQSVISADRLTLVFVELSDKQVDVGFGNAEGFER